MFVLLFKFYLFGVNALQAGDFLHYEDDLHGPYELKAPANPVYETLIFHGQPLLEKLELGVVLPRDYDKTKAYPT